MPAPGHKTQSRKYPEQLKRMCSLQTHATAGRTYSRVSASSSIRADTKSHPRVCLKDRTFAMKASPHDLQRRRCFDLSSPTNTGIVQASLVCELPIDWIAENEVVISGSR